MAGAKRVISTIWEVSATASEMLIENFYNSLLENRGITIRKNLGKTGDTQEYNFKHGSWSFVVVP